MLVTYQMVKAEEQYRREQLARMFPERERHRIDRPAKGKGHRWTVRSIRGRKTRLAASEG